MWWYYWGNKIAKGMCLLFVALRENSKKEGNIERKGTLNRKCGIFLER